MRPPPRAGDLCCYNIADPEAPRLAGRVWLGGVLAASGGSVTAADPADLEELGLEGQPTQAVVKGVTLQVRGPPARVCSERGEWGFWAGTVPGGKRVGA